MGYIPNAVHSKCPFESFINDDKKMNLGFFFFFLKHVVCGPLATDQGKCHILFKLLFSALFLNLCALAVHMYLPVSILGVESLFSPNQETCSIGRQKELCDY